MTSLQFKLTESKYYIFHILSLATEWRSCCYPVEIKNPFSINNHPVHTMAPKEIAIQYPSFFMDVHEDTI